MTVPEIKARAVAQSGLVRAGGDLAAYFHRNREEVTFRVHQIMSTMMALLAVWRPHRPGLPKPWLRCHLVSQGEGTGMVRLEGDHGTWGMWASFEEDPLFQELYAHALARVDVAYVVKHAEGLEACLADPGSVGMGAVKEVFLEDA